MISHEVRKEILNSTVFKWYSHFFITALQSWRRHNTVRDDLEDNDNAEKQLLL